MSKAKEFGILNKIFGYVYYIRVFGKRIKTWDNTTCHVIKWVLVGLILYALFVR